MSLDSQIGEIGKLLELVVSRAKAELQSDGSVHTALAALNQVSKLANTLTSIGPGTKVTNVVEAPELFEVFDNAMSEEGVPNDQALRVMSRVKAWKDGT